MTLVITKEIIYFLICFALLALQVYQHTRILKLKKELHNLTTQVMLMFFNMKYKTDEEKQAERKETV